MFSFLLLRSFIVVMKALCLTPSELLIGSGLAVNDRALFDDDLITLSIDTDTTGYEMNC